MDAAYARARREVPVDTEPVVLVDYTAQTAPFEGSDMRCAPSPKGLKCTASAAKSSTGAVWAAFGPLVSESVQGLRTLDLELVAHTGPTSGVAWGIGDGRWTGVLLSNDPKSMGAAWFGAWDGAGWVPYRDWGEPVVKKGWGPHTIHVEFLDDGQVQVAIDGTTFATARPSVPMGGGIAPVMMGFTRTDFVRLSLGGGTVHVDAPPPEPAAPAPAGPAPLSTVQVAGKWEWMELTHDLPEALYDGWNDVAADGDRLLVQNHMPKEDGSTAVRLFAAGRCGRDPFQEIQPSPATDAALAAAGAERQRLAEHAEDPRYAGRQLAFHDDGHALFAVEGAELYVSGDGGATWKVAHTIGLEPVPRFAQLLTCGPNLLLVPEVPAVWESMKPSP
jgi:hypothetical protein